MRTRLFLSFALLALVGCATGVRLASPAADAAAKTFQPPAGKANLYAARSGGSSGVNVAFKVAVDGKDVGSIGPGTFLLAALTPGHHYVTVSSGINTARTSLDAEAGKNYFYEVTSSSGGYSAQPSLGVVVIEAMGKLMVQQDKRALGTEE